MIWLLATIAAVCSVGLAFVALVSARALVKAERRYRKIRAERDELRARLDGRIVPFPRDRSNDAKRFSR
jgi:uncharacterized membrane-anchored protein YhcB (DUF1043 family)